MNIRIGQGFDVHQLQDGKDFWLGGIKIPHTAGAIGHSDADVLIHSICDALLGATNLRDIGYHFSDTDAAYKGIDSKILLKRTIEMVREKGYEIGNIDTVLCLQAPKIAPFIAEMQLCLANVLGIDTENISIKATTTEKLGFVGRKEGVSAYATVLVYKK
ncbi:MAG: 2-C-methyl-D-erythritol 2,4-cyclodiphosphate synthase [Bacteroidetes bacterium]|nr:MAG: 2-C-methyl-D-erythritol 2,4-cyclodiphosphate synthase [Bacteroidota bacterium]